MPQITDGTVLRSHTALVLEDEPVIATHIEALLRENGYRVPGVASTRGELTVLAERFRPDVLLADIQLADGSDGIEAAADIKDLYGSSVVFVTAFPERLLSASRRPEPSSLVTKPFSEEVLLSAIQRALEGRVASGDVSGEAAHDLSIITDELTRSKGVRFIERGDDLALERRHGDDDLSAACKPVFGQLAQQVRARAASWNSYAVSISNQLGWEAAAGAADRLTRLASLDASELADKATELWATVVEVGSFLDLDTRLRGSNSDSNAPELKLEARRTLESLVVVAAPWARLLPTARQLDEEAGSFLAEWLT